MPNRTISLDDVSDAIRIQLANEGVNFSHWVRQQLKAHVLQEKSEVKVDKPKPQKNYLCRNCMQPGHWTADCPYLEAEQ